VAEFPKPPTDWTKHPLHLAARNGNVRDCEFLLSQGSDINEDSGLEGKPLHVATRHGHFEVVRLLLAKGANVHAERHGQWDEFAGTALHDVAATCHTRIAELLLDYGANINCKEYRGRTPLHRAVSQGNGAMVDFLVSRGADLNVRADWDSGIRAYALSWDRGMTPLHLAAISGFTEIVRRLVAAGAATDIKVGKTDCHREFEGLTAFELERLASQQAVQTRARQQKLAAENFPPSACPKCGFSDSWDGADCTHCKYGKK
jgi:ankyrin repeat protein